MRVFFALRRSEADHYPHLENSTCTCIPGHFQYLLWPVRFFVLLKRMFCLHASSSMKKLVPNLGFVCDCGIPEKASFGLSLFFSFHFILADFWEASGSLLTLFGILWNLFGVLVSSLWVPLARLGCLWALSSTFCDTLVSFWVPFVSV